MRKYLAALFFVFFVGCSAEKTPDPAPLAKPGTESPIASQFQGLWHRRTIDEENKVDVDVYLLISTDWVITIGPDGEVGWEDSEGRTDEQNVLWITEDGEPKMFGSLTRDGDNLRGVYEDGQPFTFGLDAKTMKRDEAIAFLAKRYKENPEAYHNELGRRYVLPPPAHR
jgi:hypothetical protein